MPVTYVSATPDPIAQTQFVGPQALANPGPRDHYKHKYNETASRIDEVYDKTIRNPGPVEAARLKTPGNLIDDYTSVIEEHFDRRLVIFIQQVLACYGARYHFEVGPTMNQAESATSLELVEGGQTTKLCVRNAAHSSTFPCLIAYPKDQWDHYVQHGGVKPTGFVYLKDSDLYHGMNATIDLPRDVNDADIALDGAHHNSLFSQHAMNVLNRISVGQITPQQAVKEFLEASHVQIQNQIPTARTPGIKKALEQYAAKVAKEYPHIIANSDWIFQHTNVAMNQFAHTDHMKAMMLRIRCTAIRNHYLKQTEIAARIEQVRNAVFNSFNFKRTPDHLEAIFRYLVIEQMPTPEDKRRMQTYFAIPPRAQFVEGMAKGAVTKLNNTETLLRTQIQAIDSLSREISLMMYRMRVEEELGRGDAMRALRAGKGWTQEQLGQEIRRLFPYEPSSAPTICKTEKGNRRLTDSLAEKLTVVLNVPRGLIAAQFFNS